jgi:threonine-phosphate decarboxylase
MKKQMPNNNILQFEMENLSKAIANRSFHKTYKVINTNNNIFLENILNSTSLINKVYSSDTNIIMVEVDESQYEYLKNNLKKYGIIIESNILRYKKNKYIRFCVKKNNDLQQLKYVLEQIEEEL